MEAAVAARADSEHKIGELMEVAHYLDEAGWKKESEDIIAELLTLVRKAEDPGERVSGLCGIACVKSGKSWDWWRLDSSPLKKAERNDIYPIYQEAMTIASRIEDAKKREGNISHILKTEVNTGFLADALRDCGSLRMRNVAKNVAWRSVRCLPLYMTIGRRKCWLRHFLQHSRCVMNSGGVAK